MFKKIKESNIKRSRLKGKNKRNNRILSILTPLYLEVIVFTFVILSMLIALYKTVTTL